MRRWVLRKVAVVFISVFRYRIQVRLLSFVCMRGRWQLPWHEVSKRNPSFLVPSNKIFNRVLLRSVLGEVHVLWRHIENTRLERNRGGEETGDDTDYDDKLVNKWPGILRPVNHYSYIRASYNDDDDKKEKKRKEKTTTMNIIIFISATVIIIIGLLKGFLLFPSPPSSFLSPSILCNYLLMDTTISLEGAEQVTRSDCQR